MARIKYTAIQLILTGVFIMMTSAAFAKGKDAAVMPVVFVGHGSPMNVMENNDFTRSLAQLGKTLPRPKAILCISAHWVSKGTLITGAREPEQIYDFYGFPEEMYAVKYRPHGSPELAKKIETLLADVHAKADSSWGIDHGAWTVLKHMYPAADIPVLQLSLDGTKSERAHYEVGKKLQALRGEGVLIIGSGNVAHNLRMIDYDMYTATVAPWAVNFDAFVKDNLDAGNDEKLIDFAAHTGRNGQYAVPTNEHYLPMLYIAALRRPGEKVRYIYEGFQNGSISMRSFVIEQAKRDML